MRRLSIGIGFLLCSCAQLGPDLRTSDADLQGGLVEGCKNVSVRPVTGGYTTNFYRTTWGSAWAEGAAAGIDEGLSRSESRVSSAVRNALLLPVSNQDRVFNDYLSGVRPYCRTYSANRRNVSLALSGIIDKLGHDVIVNDVDRGIFQLGLIDRSHIAAKWKEGYVATVTEERMNRVVVRILRSVYISRQGSAFHQANSDGHNEAWIMQELGHTLSPAN